MSGTLAGAADAVARVLKLRQALWQHGYRPLAVYGPNEPGKVPQSGLSAINGRSAQGRIHRGNAHPPVRQRSEHWHPVQRLTRG